MTISEVTNNWSSGTSATLSFTPGPTTTVGDLLVLLVGSGRSPLDAGSAPTISDLAGWVPIHDVGFYQGVTYYRRRRRTRAWARYYQSGDSSWSVTCGGMGSGESWGGVIWTLRGLSGPLVAATDADVSTSQRPDSGDPWNADDPGAAVQMVNILARCVTHSTVPSTWTPDASWDCGRKRETSPSLSLYVAARLGPAAAGTVSLTAGGTSSDVCTVSTFSENAVRRPRTSVGILVVGAGVSSDPGDDPAS